VDGQAYRDLDNARTKIGDFIEAVYNRQRLDSAPRYLSPNNYELLLRYNGKRHRTQSIVARTVTNHCLAEGRSPVYDSGTKRNLCAPKGPSSLCRQ
jgi:hypothetical protein